MGRPAPGNGEQLPASVLLCTWAFIQSPTLPGPTSWLTQLISKKGALRTCSPECCLQPLTCFPYVTLKSGHLCWQCPPWALRVWTSISTIITHSAPNECTGLTRYTRMCVHVCVHAVPLVVSDSATLLTVACQAPLSMGFSKQECWSGLLCPLSGDLPYPRLEPTTFSSPALAGKFFTRSAT